MTTYTILNTTPEDNNIIIFVGITYNDNYTEESFRFTLKTSFLDILKALQNRCTWYDNREIELQKQYEELQSQLLDNEITQ